MCGGWVLQGVCTERIWDALCSWGGTMILGCALNQCCQERWPAVGAEAWPPAHADITATCPLPSPQPCVQPHSLRHHPAGGSKPRQAAALLLCCAALRQQGQPDAAWQTCVVPTGRARKDSADTSCPLVDIC